MKCGKITERRFIKCSSGILPFNLVELTIQYLKPAQLCTELHCSQLCNVDISSTH